MQREAIGDWRIDANGFREAAVVDGGERGPRRVLYVAAPPTDRCQNEL